MRKNLILIWGLFALLLASCHPRPVEDLVLADVAVKAAQKVKAEILAPDTYRQAENFFLRAKKDYAEGYFDSAKKFANEARMTAEQAEYQALLKQSKIRGGGNFVPDANVDGPPPDAGAPKPGMEAPP